MAIGDKNKSGNRKDLASHFSFIEGGSPACGTKGYGFSTNKIEDVDCEKCTNYLMVESAKFNDKQK